ncbi:hypothetical protein KM92CIT3_80168 [uncultured Citrobacter sp.]|uniref:Uncharacterized protein n=1 Tax=uncultured Citrobacter sp. TaxID=200446 RepID=A0A212IK70_9ENTR|nr:hypothetical protein KM92CIT3_80168 [uncultured Citrobacter sp.]
MIHLETSMKDLNMMILLVLQEV